MTSLLFEIQSDVNIFYLEKPNYSIQNLSRNLNDQRIDH